MGTIYRHTQLSRATVGGMGIAWAAAVWWSLRVSNPVTVTTAVLVGFVLVLFQAQFCPFKSRAGLEVT
jgi:hypothetical protein